MQFRVEEVSPVEKKLDVEVEWPVVAAKLDTAYKELGRDVTLRGFRKGKVPRNMLERMFSRQVEQEVVKQLVQETFVRAAQQHSLQPVAEPIVDEVQLQKGNPFRYTARIEVRAPLDPTGYEGIALEKPAPQITVEEIDRALERKREELSQYKPIEGRDTLGTSDIVICEVRGEVADRPFHRDTLIVDLGMPERAPIAGLAQALVGKPLAPGSEIPVELDMPAPPAAEGEAPGPAKKAILKVIVKETREKIMPALDDEFAKDTGEADTLDELRGKVREQIAADKEREGKRELQEQLMKELLKRNEFQVASSLVDRQSDALLHRAKMTMAMQGIDVRNAPLDETRMRDQLRPAATDEVRKMLLLDAIATKEKVEVTEAEMEKRLAEMARGRDQSVARLKAELQKEGRYDLIRHQLREEKTLDLLLSRANITPKSEPTPSEK